MIQSRIGQFDQAAETIGHDRTEDYGDPAENISRTALLWSAIVGAPITAQQVAHMMIALKISRLQQQPDHLDSLIDIVGYARCAVLCGPTSDRVEVTPTMSELCERVAAQELDGEAVARAIAEQKKGYV